MAMNRISLTAPLALWLVLMLPQATFAAGGPVAPVQGSYIGLTGSPYRYAAFDARRNTVVRRQGAGAGPASSELRVSGRYGIPGVDYSGSTTLARRFLAKPVVDPHDRGEAMTGVPINRVMSSDDRWAYTLVGGAIRARPRHGRAPGGMHRSPVALQRGHRERTPRTEPWRHDASGRHPQWGAGGDRHAYVHR
jgi:hypothetical protein